MDYCLGFVCTKATRIKFYGSIRVRLTIFPRIYQEFAMWQRDPDDFLSLPKKAAKSASGEDLYFVILNEEILGIVEQGVPRPVTADEFRWLDVEVHRRIYMGEWRGSSCYALEASGAVPPGYASSDLRGWLGRVEPSLFYLAGRAKQLIAWRNTHAYCGKCGTATEDHRHDRATQCPSCGLVNYPRLSPSIIVLVVKGRQALLARNAMWPTRMFSTLAGFVEPGESIEQTVHREVKEEVGIRVKNLKYLGSQSWPFPNSLMLGFHAEYASGEISYRDGEIAEADWFDIDDLPNVPGGTAISRWLIDTFAEQVKANES